jgi:glycine hydroxymethyltransferase
MEIALASAIRTAEGVIQMTMLSPRPWVPEAPERYVQSLAARVAGRSADEIERDLIAYVAENRTIHERDCVNLNPATNVMNPKA